MVWSPQVDFDTFQVAFKGNWLFNRWYSLIWREMGAGLYFLCGICTVDAFAALQELASNIFLICHRCRDKFEPFGNNVDLVVSESLVWFYLCGNSFLRKVCSALFASNVCVDPCTFYRPLHGGLIFRNETFVFLNIFIVWRSLQHVCVQYLFKLVEILL